jgi:diguanylate cyclase (GGDEF)-like protein
LIICDIDRFKRVNDTYGHQAGDEAIKGFAQLLKSACRPGDLVARYGGEEFVLILPETDQESAFQVAEKIREEIRISTFSSNNQNFSLTVSIGISSISAKRYLDWNEMLHDADLALYSAKHNGKNRAEVFCPALATNGTGVAAHLQ